MFQVIPELKDHVIKPVSNRTKNQSKNLVFKVNHPRLLMVAEPLSGKSTVMANLVKDLVDKNTIVVIFASHCYNDDAYKHMFDYFIKNDIPYNPKTSFIDPKTNEDRLQSFVDHIKSKNKERQRQYDPFASDSEEDDITLIPKKIDKHQQLVNRLREEVEKEPIKYLVIIDDLASDIKSNDTLFQLLTTADHGKTSVVVITQQLSNCPPRSRGLYSHFALFQGLQEDKLTELFKNIGSNMKVDYLIKAYNQATEKKPDDPKDEKSHNFLFIDKNRKELRRNLNEAYNP